MRRYQFAGLFLVLAGVLIAVWPVLMGDRTPLKSMSPVGNSATPSTAQNAILTANTSNPDSREIVGTPLVISAPTRMPANPPDAPSTYLDYLAGRALREAEAAAQRAATSFMKEMLAPVEANDRSFAERLYSIGAKARAISKNEANYRDYVSTRFYEELTRNANMQRNLDAIAFEYLDRLGRIAAQAALESGVDVTNLPSVTLTIKDFDGILRSEIRESVSATASAMRSQSRQGSAVQLVSFGIGLLMPTTFVIDLAIGVGLDTAANSYRDPTGEVAMDAHRAAETLAQRICFGTDEHEGLYAGLLDIAHFQNRQIREALRRGESISQGDDLNPVFGGERE